MYTFSKYIEETFVNLFGDDPRKHKHAKEVHDMLQQSYKKVGGIHGSGFRSPEDMVKNIPMWKLKRHNGKIVSAAMYKDKGGRKLVASGSDGSPEGKKGVVEIGKSDLSTGRAYGEKSGPSLSALKKNKGVDFIKQNAIPFNDVKKHVDKSDEIRKPQDDDEEVTRHPELKNHFYQRKIGDEWHTKIMLGKPGIKIY